MIEKLVLTLVSISIGVPALYIAILFASYTFKWNSFINRVEKRDLIAENYPTIAIVICTYNEARVIEQKIRNLLSLDYPRERVKFYFVDANSSDGTLKVIRKYAEKDDRFKIYIQSKRRGQNHAENMVMEHINEDIVVLTDAEVLFKNDALKKIVKYMLNKEIGAVTGRQKILGSGVMYLIERIYRGIYYCMRRGESIIDSTFHVHGDMLAFRRSLWKPLNEHRGADDACIAFNVRRQGYKVIHADDLVFYEYAPERFSERYLQKVKRAAVLIESLIMNKDFIFNSRYGLFGYFIVPFNFFMMLILPLINMSALVSCTLYIIYEGISVYSIMLLLLLLAESYVFGLIQLLHGMIRVFITRRNRNVIWEKIESTRRYITFE